MYLNTCAAGNCGQVAANLDWAARELGNTNLDSDVIIAKVSPGRSPGHGLSQEEWRLLQVPSHAVFAFNGSTQVQGVCWRGLSYRPT